MMALVLELQERVARLELRAERMVRWGTIASVDPSDQRATVRLPSGLVIGPMPWAVTGARLFVAPAKGEQCVVLAPPGDGARAVAICGIGTKGSGQGDTHVIGADGTAQAVALAPKVEAELNKIISALTTVSAGGGSFTGANSYTTAGDVAAAKTKAE